MISTISRIIKVKFTENYENLVNLNLTFLATGINFLLWLLKYRAMITKLKKIFKPITWFN